jgi:hypothetical protein
MVPTGEPGKVHVHESQAGYVADLDPRTGNVREPRGEHQLGRRVFKAPGEFSQLQCGEGSTHGDGTDTRRPHVMCRRSRGAHVAARERRLVGPGCLPPYSQTATTR